MTELLGLARERAEAFAAAHRGKVVELDAAGLAAAMRELEAISDAAGRAGSYAMLSFAVDTQAPETGALLQQARELGAAIETELLFFELEWNEVPDEQAERLLADPALAFCAHHLRNQRRYLPHQLSEPEERILTETGVTGRSAFTRLFTEQISSIEVQLPDVEGPAQLELALSRLQDPDRERRAARPPERSPTALRTDLRTRAFVFNTLLADKATKDRLRTYPSLDRLAQPRQRGERRVGRGADRRRHLALRAGAALVPPQGTVARRRAAGPLRPHGAGRRERGAHPLRRGARAGARLLRRLLAGARRGGAQLLPRRLRRRPAAARQARRRLLLVHGALGAPVRDAQLHLAPLGRAGDGPRARPRRARVAGAARRACSTSRRR